MNPMSLNVTVKQQEWDAICERIDEACALGSTETLPSFQVSSCFEAVFFRCVNAHHLR
jgi:hypothetical protein